MDLRSGPGSAPDTNSPLLGTSSSQGAPQTNPQNRTSPRRTIQAASYFRRAGSSRLMREQSLQVRESAAEQLEERQSDWAYSRPVVVLDLVWNLAFVIVAAVILFLSKDEKPKSNLRLWIAGYAAQCLVHMVCVFAEFKRRRRRAGARRTASGSVVTTTTFDSRRVAIRTETEGGEPVEPASLAKRLESANTMFSFAWWIVGFYWITAGGQKLAHNAPCLYWLSVVFLAFDVFFVVFCVALACVIGIAVCCCLPCIIAILYAVADQEGASEDDIRALPVFKFRLLGGDKEGASEGGVLTPQNGGEERKVSADNAECCICLSPYEDGAELRELPCTHHFHSPCIDKWLKINATCPLCKYNIVNGAPDAPDDTV
eukprot:TRINITY_DN282_c0_g1_i1.p1 TRINITY_DN282_c0_g1~~TRINITY_DN282_c0_g1_i1.p1  ORF type:complete len:372 (-),score=31.96 TRINITY_DN282_c0_g1_i1:333-1448(-)